MTTAWWRVAVRCEAVDADRVAALLVNRTGQAVEETALGAISAAVPTAHEAAQLAADLSHEFPALDVELSELPTIDWSVRWRDGIETRRFGRLVVTPSWLPVATTPDTVVVTLDPESAFGSGEHGSTRAAMALLERHLRSGNRVLDFGSGSGILAVAATRLGAAWAVGIEVDSESVPIARANAEKNGVADVTTFLCGDAGELGPLAGPVEVVCSNILRTVNTLLLPAVARALVPGGLAIFSGMEDAEEEMFRPVLEREGWRVVDDVHDAGWWGVAARRAD